MANQECGIFFEEVILEPQAGSEQANNAGPE
jgi:hypothetical protein